MDIFDLLAEAGGLGAHLWRGWLFLLMPAYRRERYQVWRVKGWAYAVFDVGLAAAFLILELCLVALCMLWLARHFS